MDNITIVIENPKKVFNDVILKALKDYSARTEIHYGGASSGKSHGVLQKIIIKACGNYKTPRKVLFLRKVGSTIRDSIFQHCKDVLEEFALLTHCKINKTDYTIQLPNGAVFLFKGLDDPEKIKSIKGVSDVVMEEATEFTEEDYQQLNLRLRDRQHIDKQIFMMFNPVSKANWVYKYFFEQQTDAKIIWSNYTDNRFIDDITKNELEKLKERNPAYYRIYALGEFATLDKLVFPVIEKRLISKEEVEDYKLFIGLDFGYVNDPSALIWGLYNKNDKEIYITGEYVKKKMFNDEIARVIKELGLHKEMIIADCAEQKSIEDIKRNGVPKIKPAVKGKDSVLFGIQFILQHKIIIDERCFKTIEEFENYTWKKDKKTAEYINEPVDCFNHCLDALRYALLPYSKMTNTSLPETGPSNSYWSKI